MDEEGVNKMKNEWNSIEAFMAENLQAFRPFAYFDKHLDCIRVKILDCSVTEIRLSRIFTVLRPNHGLHAKTGRNVGFTIKGIAHIFDELKLPMSGVRDLTEILDGIVKVYPDAAVKRVTEEFSQVLKEEKLQVNFEEEKMAA